MVEFAVSAPAITCDIDVFGRLGNTAAEYQRIGLSDLSGRLRAAGISSAAVRKIACGHGNVVLVMADKSSSLYFLELDTRYEGIRDDLQSIGVEELAFGKTHLLAVGADRRVRSAGCNANAQLGLGSAPDDKGNHALAVVPKVHDVMAVACGDRHSVALTRRGDVYTWGSSEHGQCAGLRLIHLSPFVVVGLPPIASIACGDDFTVALAAGSGSVWTFGGNQCGQLGHGRRSTCERRPRSVPLFRAATRIAAGSAHALVLDVDGTVYAWGLNACGQLGLPGRGSRVRAPTRLDLTMPDGCRAIEVLCGPNFSCVLDTAGNVTTFGSDSPRGRLGRPGEKTDDPGRISVAAASGRPVCRIAQCASALICATATSISHIDVSSLCASGGTLITLFGNGMASINGLVWVRFRYLPYLDLTVEVDCSIYEGEPGPFCVRVVSPCLTKLVPGELFPLKNLEISTSMDGTFYSAPLPVAVFRAIESLNAGERQCGPVSGGSPVTLSVDVDDLPYPDLRVQLIPENQLGRSPSVKPPDVPAVYDRTKKQITFKTPPTDDAGACHFAIALDGKTFVEYAEPKFVYYDAQLSSIDPASVPFGGGPLCVKMTGLDHPLLLDIQPVPRVRVTALSTGAVLESSGSADRLSLECIMRFDLPQLPFQGRNERVKIDVSYNGNEFMPCGQVEYEPPRAERLVPESGPKARDNSVVVAGSGFYEQQSLDVFLSPEQTVHSTFVDRSTIRFTLPVGIVLPSIQVALDASMRNALTYTLYDEPTSFKLEPSAGAAAGGYPVKLTAKNVFDTRASAVRVTGSSGGPAQVVPCQMTSEPNPKTGLAVVTFTMPSMLADPPSKTCTVELSLNGVDFTMVDVPFTLK